MEMESIEMLELAIEQLKVEKELHAKLRVEVEKNPKPIKLDFEYQKTEAYWEIQKEFRALEFDKAQKQYEIMIESATKTLEAKKVEEMKNE